jgi:hypothetical protein
MHNINDCIYTEKSIKDLYKSLNYRFGEYIENDCFKLATLLDPSMGIKYFSMEGRTQVKERLKYHLSLLNPLIVNKSSTNKSISFSPQTNYIFHEDPDNEIIEFDDYDKTITLH